MNELELDSHLKALVKTYFSDPSKHFVLRKGDFLMRHKQLNNRLYLVLQGALQGYVDSPDGDRIELFHATRGMFVGVYSFFSRTFCCSSNVIAEEDTEVAYIDADQPARPVNGVENMCEQFMPIIVDELVHRTQRAQRVAIEKERALKKLVQTEKLASLGQMAAGIAHELNNTIAVLIRNTEWISDTFAFLCKKYFPDLYMYYQTGLQEGRRFSTREVRHRQKELMKTFDLDADVSGKIAQTGFADEILNTWPDSPAAADRVFRAWEMGATLHDMALAGRHSKHVVRSVKTLGAPVLTRKTVLDVNKSIHETLSLMGSSLRTVNVVLQLSVLPAIFANEGELVQIWSNLIKNAVESMQGAKTPNPELVITSAQEKDGIYVQVQDNGPGIDSDLLPAIFQPNTTTKTDGLSFGLGLGLTITARLVSSYNGNISVKSAPGETIFTVYLPEGKNDEKA